MGTEIDIDLLRRLLRYDPETGRLYWLPRPLEMFANTGCGGAEGNAARWNGKCAGKPALTAKCRGYYHGPIFRQKYYAHRVAWALHYGAWPEGEIDHINHDHADNRIANLRVVSRQENCLNQPQPRTNSSGVTGVYWDKNRKLWLAAIQVDGRARHLGRFADIQAAIQVRKAAERQHGFHRNHGKAAA